MLIDSKWDRRFMRLAREISTWSKDPAAQIGAVIIRDRRILATGYNGFPEGIEDTPERLNDKEQKYPRVIHGEMNALLNALNNGVSVRGSTLYVYGLPICADCTKSVIQSGISRIVIPYAEMARVKWFIQWVDISRPMFEEANVQITEVDTDTLDNEQITFRIKVNTG
jgi:dCMP deaminase